VAVAVAPKRQQQYRAQLLALFTLLVLVLVLVLLVLLLLLDLHLQVPPQPPVYVPVALPCMVIRCFPDGSKHILLLAMRMMPVHSSLCTVQLATSDAHAAPSTDALAEPAKQQHEPAPSSPHPDWRGLKPAAAAASFTSASAASSLPLSGSF
jgi:hypothetical protein